MVHFALCISLLVFTYIFLDSFFLQLYLTSDLRSFQKVFLTLLYLLKTIHYTNLSPTVMGCLNKKWKGGKLTCTLKVKSRMQWSCFHKMLYNFQSLIIMTSFKVCKKVPPARSELGCWQFLSVMVEDSALWPSGEAWIWRSACPCKFLLCLHVSLFHLSPHKHFFYTVYECFLFLLLSLTSTALRFSMQLSIVFCFFQANMKLLIIHCKTNQALAALGDQVLWYFPFFFLLK